MFDFRVIAEEWVSDRFDCNFGRLADSRQLFDGGCFLEEGGLVHI